MKQANNWLALQTGKKIQPAGCALISDYQEYETELRTIIAAQQGDEKAWALLWNAYAPLGLSILSGKNLPHMSYEERLSEVFELFIGRIQAVKVERVDSDWPYPEYNPDLKKHRIFKLWFSFYHAGCSIRDTLIKRNKKLGATEKTFDFDGVDEKTEDGGYRGEAGLVGNSLVDEEFRKYAPTIEGSKEETLKENLHAFLSSVSDDDMSLLRFRQRGYSIPRIADITGKPAQALTDQLDDLKKRASKIFNYNYAAMSKFSRAELKK
jgi:hypothetical protein